MGRIGFGSERLSKSSNNDDQKFKPVHLFPTNDVGQPPKQQLTNHRPARSGNLNGCIRVFRNLARFPVDEAKHPSYQIDRKNLDGARQQEFTEMCVGVMAKKQYSHRRNP